MGSQNLLYFRCYASGIDFRFVNPKHDFTNPINLLAYPIIHARVIELGQAYVLELGQRFQTLYHEPSTSKK